MQIAPDVSAPSEMYTFVWRRFSMLARRVSFTVRDEIIQRDTEPGVGCRRGIKRLDVSPNVRICESTRHLIPGALNGSSTASGGVRRQRGTEIFSLLVSP